MTHQLLQFQSGITTWTACTCRITMPVLYYEGDSWGGSEVKVIENIFQLHSVFRMNYYAK